MTEEQVNPERLQLARAGTAIVVNRDGNIERQRKAGDDGRDVVDGEVVQHVRRHVLTKQQEPWREA